MAAAMSRDQRTPARNAAGERNRIFVPACDRPEWRFRVPHDRAPQPIAYWTLWCGPHHALYSYPRF